MPLCALRSRQSFTRRPKVASRTLSVALSRSPSRSSGQPRIACATGRSSSCPASTSATICSRSISANSTITDSPLSKHFQKPAINTYREATERRPRISLRATPELSELELSGVVVFAFHQPQRSVYQHDGAVLLHHLVASAHQPEAGALLTLLALDDLAFD